MSSLYLARLLEHASECYSYATNGNDSANVGDSCNQQEDYQSKKQLCARPLECSLMK